MTLKEAEMHEDYQHFKFMDMLTLVSYIARCTAFLAKEEDSEVRRYYEAAKLIRDSRSGINKKGVS